MANFIGDQLFPATTEDSLVGAASNDYLFGGDLSDTLIGGDGVDSIDGGAGIDWIQFTGVSNGVTINLQAVAVPVQPVLLVSLEEGSAGVVGFDTTSTIENDPAGGNNKVVKVVKGTGALGAAGTTVFTGANQSIDVIPFTADSTTMTLRVYMETSDPGVRVRLKVENAANNRETCEADAFTVAGVGWQTLTFDFANAATNNGNPTARLDLDYTFNKASVFFNFGLSSAGGGGGTFYFDDLTFVKSPDPSGTIADDGFGNSESIANVENVLGSNFGDRITGGEGANTLQGVDGNDTIDGGSGNDLLEGGAGNDSLLGSAGNDNLVGAAGNDTLNGGDGVDTLAGGDGNDTVSFSTAAAGVEVVLRSGTSSTTVVSFDETTPPLFTDFGPDDGDPANAGVNVGSVAADPAGGSNLVGKFVKGAAAFEWAGVVVSTGPNFSVDTLALSATDKTMTLRVWTEKPGVQVLLKLENASDAGINTGAFATTSVVGGWETLTFTFGPALPGPNTGVFNPASVYNKAVLFFDFGKSGSQGGAGTFYFDDLRVVNTAVGEVVDDGYGNAEVVTDVENAVGSDFADRLTGDSKSNSLSGGDGNDTLTGGSGNDNLNGGTGNDSMVGGSGNDAYSVDSSGDRVVESSGQGTDRVSASVTHTLADNVENLTLSGSSSIGGTGNSLANSITGNSGNNSLNGAAGNDTLSGGSGNDTINGGAGIDSLVGGSGNDSYVVDSSSDLISETSTLAGEIDTVTSSVSWTLGSNLEMLVLTGSAGLSGVGNSLANTITGNTGSNSLDGASGNDTLDGGSGNDTLNGGSGSDSMIGGAGNDNYSVNSSGDQVVEVSGGGTDSVFASIGFTLPSGVEKLTLTGASGLSGTGNTSSNTITGNTGSNELTGANGNDSLYGGDGNDTLDGGNGNDLLDGGNGNDSMTGGAGNDRYVVNSSADKVVEAAGGGTDSVSSSVSLTLAAEVENLTLTGTSAINGIGNTLANTLVGNTGNNKLTAGGGNDTVTGGAGLDTFRFSSALNASTNVDMVTDFNPVDDTLELENSVFTKLTSTGVLSSSNFRASSTGNAADSNDYVLYETDTGNLFYDADGSGSGAKVLIATLGTLNNPPTLTSADIFVT